jgi:hypothetical protein
MTPAVKVITVKLKVEGREEGRKEGREGRKE